MKLKIKTSKIIRKIQSLILIKMSNSEKKEIAFNGLFFPNIENINEIF